MTNEDKQKEAERAEKARAENVKKTLESTLIQNSIGSNLVKNNPSDFGKFGFDGANAAYNKAMNSEDAIKDKNGYLIEYGNKMELSLIIKSILLNETYPTINSNIIREWKTVGEEFFNLFEILINIRHESKKSRINTL